MPENHFGEDVAARYDDPSDSMFARSAIAPVVDLLAELAGGGDALELGIGTGRIAVPRQAGKQVDHRRDRRGCEHAVGGIVVAGRDVLAEVVLGHATL